VSEMHLGLPLALGYVLKTVGHNGQLPTDGVRRIQGGYWKSYGQISTELQFLLLLKSCQPMVNIMCFTVIGSLEANDEKVVVVNGLYLIASGKRYMHKVFYFVTYQFP